MKNFENLQTINEQATQEHELIERKSKNILNHRMSLCSLSTPTSNNDHMGRQLQSSSRRNSSIFERQIVLKKMMIMMDMKMVTLIKSVYH